MIKSPLVILIFSFFIAANKANAIEIIDDGYSWSLNGEIRKGDTQKALNLLKGRKDWQMPAHLYLNSPGGDVVEALLLSEVLRKLHVRLTVSKGGICASACFFLYIAGSTRDADGSFLKDGRRVIAGKLGLHRPYLRGVSDALTFEAEQRSIMRKISIYLDNQRVPRRLIDKMMSHSSVDIYWVTREDLREIGRERAETEEIYLAQCADLEGGTIDYGAIGTMEVSSNMRRAGCAIAIQKELRGDWPRKLSEGKWFPSNPLDAIP
ncbi:ATP-dependent Clp protease proteolytic subunit [Noviherbaspirillum sp.]|uniref:ATP-dependent Clp protease proteolytic subunit n=1 Tax=Noviherbaspirillum sp. TaxID=1926288 RepID=UPI002FE1B8AE